MLLAFSASLRSYQSVIWLGVLCCFFALMLISGMPWQVMHSYIGQPPAEATHFSALVKPLSPTVANGPLVWMTNLVFHETYNDILVWLRGGFIFAFSWVLWRVARAHVDHPIYEGIWLCSIALIIGIGLNTLMVAACLLTLYCGFFFKGVHKDQLLLVLVPLIAIAGLVNSWLLVLSLLVIILITIDDLLYQDHLPLYLCYYLGVMCAGWLSSGSVIEGLPGYVVTSIDYGFSYYRDQEAILPVIRFAISMVAFITCLAWVAVIDQNKRAFWAIATLTIMLIILARHELVAFSSLFIAFILMLPVILDRNIMLMKLLYGLAALLVMYDTIAMFWNDALAHELHYSIVRTVY